jgi:integrase
VAERTIAPALKAGGRKARGFESLPFRSWVSWRSSTFASASWQSDLLDQLSPSTVADTRSTLVAILGAAQDLGLVAANVAQRVKPPRVPKPTGRAITPDEVRALLVAASGHRLGAAVALLFVQGWRVSEVLGLAWQDVDLENRTAHVVRAAVYVDGVGMVLGETKTSGATGVHPLAPGVVDALRRRLERQCGERAAAGQRWTGPHEHAGAKIDLVFTTTDGRLVTRQMITKVIATGARMAGLDSTGLGTHVGQRSVVTALYAHGSASIDDIARHVGHDSTTTTARTSVTSATGQNERPRSLQSCSTSSRQGARRADCRSRTRPGWQSIAAFEPHSSTQIWRGGCPRPALGGRRGLLGPTYSGTGSGRADRRFGAPLLGLGAERYGRLRGPA